MKTKIISSKDLNANLSLKAGDYIQSTNEQRRARRLANDQRNAKAGKENKNRPWGYTK